MLNTWQFWLLSALSAIALVLTGVNIKFYEDNRRVQETVSARAEYLQQTGPIRNLHQDIARALADLAVRNHDTLVASMLESEGFHFNGAAQKDGTSPNGGRP